MKQTAVELLHDLQRKYPVKGYDGDLDRAISDEYPESILRVATTSEYVSICHGRLQTDTIA
eukprot:scaffold74739_cov22-Prasinocladus_malaysianus.AAC.1